MFKFASQTTTRCIARRLLAPRHLSSSSSSSSEFRPRRRPNRNYRPLKARGSTKKGPKDPVTDDGKNNDPVVLGKYLDARDPLERDFGPKVADALRDRERAHRMGGEMTVEEYLQVADYLTAEAGTLEDLQGERRGLALDAWDEEDRTTFMANLDEMVEEARIDSLGLGDIEYDEDETGEGEAVTLNAEIDSQISEMEDEVDDDGEPVDPLQLAHGQWAEMVVRVDRVQKVQKGGTLVRYRALVVGGNTRGCAGFGVAKANSPQEATALASRMCKRNIFFVKPFAGSALTRDLAGRQNSCKVILRAVQPHFGLHGHPLITDILLYAGITDCTAKSYGNRNQYNVVRATFKALATHESMEEIALKRGKRLMTLERAKQLEI